MKQISRIFLFLLLLGSPIGWSQEQIVTLDQQPDKPTDEQSQDVLLSDPYLSLLYQRGAFLIYNCHDRHWVCSGEAEYKSCLEERNYALDEKTSKLPCAPIQKFKSDKACQEYQARLTDFNMGDRFCLHPDRRETERNY